MTRMTARSWMLAIGFGAATAAGVLLAPTRGPAEEAAKRPLAFADEIYNRQRQAREVVKVLAGELQSALQRELSAGGVTAAIAVCRDLAPSIAGRLSRERGWRVTRVSEQVRNPLLGTPDAWELVHLKNFREAVAAGKDPATLEVATETVEGEHNYFRYLKAIPLGPPCMARHGPADTLAPAIQSTLAEHYPHDRATGYQPGQLRGAFSVKVPLE